jgi:hypothetical protein
MLIDHSAAYGTAKLGTQGLTSEGFEVATRIGVDDVAQLCNDFWYQSSWIELHWPERRHSRKRDSNRKNVLGAPSPMRDARL